MKFAGLNENDFTNAFNNISVSFWTQGCPHHCKGCHNKETWDYHGGYELPDNYIDKIIDSIHKNDIHRDLSILGGEPLCDNNYTVVYNLVKCVKEFDSSTKIIVWSGYLYEDLCHSYKNEILKYIDVLIDGVFDISKYKRGLYLKGSTNQRVIDVNNSSFDNVVTIG